MMPPYLFDLRIHKPGEQPHHVWVPLFLLWPLGIVLLVLALVVTIVLDALVFVFGQRYHHYTMFVLGCLELLSRTRGLTAHVHSADRTTVDLTVL